MVSHPKDKADEQYQHPIPHHQHALILLGGGVERVARTVQVDQGKEMAGEVALTRGAAHAKPGDWDKRQAQNSGAKWPGATCD